MRANQKYFTLEYPDGKPAPRFVITANMVTADGGAAIVAGNERVLRARLSDARFFYDQDLKTKLADQRPKLAKIAFHAKLGTVLDRVERLEKLTVEIARSVPRAKPAMAIEAARLCKCDLVSGMVGEFPELQGVMGRYYALAQGAPDDVADAIRDHYKPLGPQRRLPHGAGHRGAGPGREDRHPGWVFRDRRIADGFEGPVSLLRRAALWA